MVVMGIAEKKGEYQGREYHNIMIHCAKEDGECYGQISEVVKVKYANVKEVFGQAMSSSDWYNLVGKTIFVNYNRYGNVQSIQVEAD